MCCIQEPIEESVSMSVGYPRLINFSIDAYRGHCLMSITGYVTMTLQQIFRGMSWNLQIIKCSFCHSLSDKHAVILSFSLSSLPLCPWQLSADWLCLVLPVPGHQGNHILNTSVAGHCQGSQDLRVYVKELLLDKHTCSCIPNVPEEFLLPF